MLRPTGIAWKGAWRKQYIRHLRKELVRVLPGEHRAALVVIKKNATAIYREKVSEAPDPQGLMIISTCALILSSYREITARGVDEDSAFEVVRTSFSSIFAPSAQRTVRWILAFTPDPVSTLRGRAFSSLFASVFGSLFSFADELDGESYLLVINKCGIYDVFREAGEPQLTRAFCAWDRNWLGEMDGSNRLVATRRSLTLVTGGSRCEFHVDRAASGPAPTVDVTR